MRLENKNENYCATIVSVKTILKLNGLDNLVGVPMFGFQALTQKTVKEGELKVLFTAETQLSGDYCRYNNLYRHKELNINPEEVGYLEDSRRVRAIKFRGNVSSAMLMPLSSLSYLGVDPDNFNEGDCFTHINNIEVCKKYVIKQPRSSMGGSSNNAQRKQRVESRLIPEHLDSANWWKNEHLIDDNEEIIVTQKIHGTSARFAHQLCDRELSYYEKWLKYFGFKVQETEYDYFACSRRVIKDLKRKDLIHYYDMDVWNQQLEKIKHLIPKNWCLYGELYGWVGESPIQSNYTYNMPIKQFSFQVYRIAIINECGYSCDLGWDQVKEFCHKNGLNHVAEMWRGKKKDFDVDKYMDVCYHKDGLTKCTPLCQESVCDEGVIIRKEGITPYLLKAKSPKFLNHESAILDKGVEDMESIENEVS